VLGVVSSSVLGVVASNICMMGSNGNRVVLKTQLEFSSESLLGYNCQVARQVYFNVCSCVTLHYLFLSIGWSRPDT